MITKYLFDFVTHFIGTCSGYGLVSGNDCFLCYRNACNVIKKKRKLP